MKLTIKDYVFKFETCFETRGCILENVGRIRLGDGTIIKLFFTPEGLKMSLGEKTFLESKCILKEKDYVEEAYSFSERKKS